MLSHRDRVAVAGGSESAHKHTGQNLRQEGDWHGSLRTKAQDVEDSHAIKSQLAQSEALLRRIAEWSSNRKGMLPQSLEEQLRLATSDQQGLSRTTSKESFESSRCNSKNALHSARTDEELLRRQLQQNFDKKLKVALADSEFQVKRLNEDFAMFKTLHQLQRAKLTKEFEGRITHLKAQLDEDNQNWINRFEIRDREFQAQSEAMRAGLQSDKLKHRESFQEELKQEQRKMEVYHSELLKEQEAKHSSDFKKLQAERDSQLQRILHNHEQELAQVKSKHIQEAERMRRQMEILLVAVRSEHKAEQNMHESTKTQMNKLKEKLYAELYEVRKESDALGVQVERLEKDKKALEVRLQDEREHLAKALEDNEAALTRLRQQYESREEDLKQAMKSKIAEILEKQLSKTEQFGSNIKGSTASNAVLQQRHSEQVELFSTQMQQIKSCYQQRPSRQEDLQMIRQLEEKLWKKEGDLELVCQELKWHRLELQNKQETYNKIFTNGYNVNINELKFPADRASNVHNRLLQRTATKEFKFRRVAKSLLTKDPKNSSGKLLQTNVKIL